MNTEFQAITARCTITSASGISESFNFTAYGQEHIYKTFLAEPRPSLFAEIAGLEDMLRFHFVENEPNQATADDPWLWALDDDGFVVWNEDISAAETVDRFAVSFRDVEYLDD